jgi:phenylacetic acid degradation operon negative regulatory protein
LSQIQKTRVCLDACRRRARIIQQLKREPSRTGSIVITVFGDAIVPRGARSGSARCWILRTTGYRRQRGAHRDVALTADSWFERHKIGRNSFYRLVQSGRQTLISQRNISTGHRRLIGPDGSSCC